MRPVLVFVLVVAAMLAASTAIAQQAAPPRVEVIEVAGIIDASVERAVVGGIEAAEASRAALVVVEVDSPGVVGEGRAARIVRRIRDARVPVATWVGPPRARAENGAALVALAGHVRSMAPATRLGPVRTVDLAAPGTTRAVLRSLTSLRGRALEALASPGLAADDAERLGAAHSVDPSLSDALASFDGEEPAGRPAIRSDPEQARVRLHGLDLVGRVLHAAATPSIVYLLLLLGLIGIVFELFHPSTGPAGISGLASLALAGYGVATLGGSWLGVALVVVGVAAFCVDLRLEGLGISTLLGFAALVAGSLLLFGGPWLRVSPWVLVFGIGGTTVFLVSAMTRVLRDLRAIARGELEVRDAHPHTEPVTENGQGNADAP